MPVDLLHHHQWWAYLPGAFWRQPEGPGGPAPQPDHPVTHVAYEDAQAYADWAGSDIRPKIAAVQLRKLLDPLGLSRPPFG